MLNLHTHTKSNEDNIINVLRVIQICDSNFPIGSFNHSYGMENIQQKMELKQKN